MVERHMNPKPLQCAHCGSEFPRTPGAGLHCGSECAEARGQKLAEAQKALIEAGFTQEGDSNIWFKDSVGVTLDGVVRDGVATTLAVHAEVVRNL